MQDNASDILLDVMLADRKECAILSGAFLMLWAGAIRDLAPDTYTRNKNIKDKVLFFLHVHTAIVGFNIPIHLLKTMIPLFESAWMRRCLHHHPVCLFYPYHSFCCSLTSKRGAAHSLDAQVPRRACRSEGSLRGPEFWWENDFRARLS
jgi:hypothetical protein